MVKTFKENCFNYMNKLKGSRYSMLITRQIGRFKIKLVGKWQYSIYLVLWLLYTKLLVPTWHIRIPIYYLQFLYSIDLFLGNNSSLCFRNNFIKYLLLTKICVCR